jgi:hypothetical protein
VLVPLTCHYPAGTARAHAIVIIIRPVLVALLKGFDPLVERVSDHAVSGGRSVLVDHRGALLNLTLVNIAVAT